MRPRLSACAILAGTIAGLFLSLTAADARPLCEDSSRACLISAAEAYIDALVVSHDGADVPLAPDVRRTENGLVNANGEHEVRASFSETKMVRDRRNLRFVVDEMQGEIVAYFLIDVVLAGPEQSETKAGDKRYKVAVSVPAGIYTVHEAERFKVEHGLIKEIEIIAHVEKGAGGASGWPD
jgi:hypothetical protein